MVNKLLTYAIVVILIIASISIICKNCQATALVKRMSAEQGVKELPAKLNKFGGTAQLASNESVSLDEAYNSGYNSGYDAGEHNATNAVYSSGYEQGIHNAMSDVYRSGYEHGVQDGKTGTIREDFVNHTAKYDQGWVDGYCSIAGEGAGSDSDKGTFECSLDATQFKGINEQTPYQHGFTGKRDAKTNLYDSANACNDYNTINNTAAQAFECLKGYADGDISPYHSGYIQGIQGIVLQEKGFVKHTQEYSKGYSKGLQGYYWNRGLVEGYSGLPPLQNNKNYTDAYKSGAAERAAGYPCTKKAGFDLGTLPAHTNDNYRDFYLGLDQGGDAYEIVDGAHYFLYDGPPGHSEEYYAGWKFGYSLGLVFDADC